MLNDTEAVLEQIKDAVATLIDTSTVTAFFEVAPDSSIDGYRAMHSKLASMCQITYDYEKYRYVILLTMTKCEKVQYRIDVDSMSSDKKVLQGLITDIFNTTYPKVVEHVNFDPEDTILVAAAYRSIWYAVLRAIERLN